jgi:hypothetical protein
VSRMVRAVLRPRAISRPPRPETMSPAATCERGHTVFYTTKDTIFLSKKILSSIPPRLQHAQRVKGAFSCRQSADRRVGKEPWRLPLSMGEITQSFGLLCVFFREALSGHPRTARAHGTCGRRCSIGSTPQSTRLLPGCVALAGCRSPIRIGQRSYCFGHTSKYRMALQLLPTRPWRRGSG